MISLISFFSKKELLNTSDSSKESKGPAWGGVEDFELAPFSSP